MIAKLLKYGQFGSRYVGVEHVVIKGDERINGLVLKLKKGELIKERSVEVEDLKALKSELVKDQHVFLILNNDQVLTKVIDPEVEDELVLSEAFPNLDLDKFYFEILKSEFKIFVSICRKDYVIQLLEDYKIQQLGVIGFSLGNLSVNQLTTFDLPSKFFSSNAELSIQNNEIIGIVKKNIKETCTYKINGLEFINRDLLSLAGILRYFMNRELNSDNMTSVHHELRGEFKQSRIFKLGLIGALSVIFFSLLISFLFFSNYTQQITSLSQELSLNKSARNTLVVLKNEVDQKEKLINDFSLSSSKASFFVDKLGKSVPNSVLLEAIRYQPILKKIKTEEKILVTKDEIHVKGMLTKAQDFSRWVNELEEMDWIDMISIEEYGLDRTSRSIFNLRIRLK